MVRGKTIGGLKEETTIDFKIIALKDKWESHDALLEHMNKLYKKYGKEG